jgi:hypothetical protein
VKRRTIAALSCAVLTLIPAEVAQAGRSFLVCCYPSWTACNNGRLEYQRDGNYRVGGCQKISINERPGGYGFMAYER